MRRFALAFIAIVTLTACNQPTTTTETATTESTTTTAAEEPPYAPLTAATAAGTWSFDGSCASGDGMVLAPDGKASVDENQSGTWSIDTEGRLIVNTQAFEPGDLSNRPLPGTATAYVFVTGQDADHLTRTDSTTPVTATRCPT